MTTGCSLSYQLEFYSASFQEWMAYSNEDFVDSWDSNTGSLTLLTADFEKYSTSPYTTQNARITVTSERSTQIDSLKKIQDTFIIRFVDSCRELNVE